MDVQLAATITQKLSKVVWRAKTDRFFFLFFVTADRFCFCERKSRLNENRSWAGTNWATFPPHPPPTPFLHGALWEPLIQGGLSLTALNYDSTSVNQPATANPPSSLNRMTGTLWSALIIGPAGISCKILIRSHEWWECLQREMGFHRIYLSVWLGGYKMGQNNRSH